MEFYFFSGMKNLRSKSKMMKIYGLNGIFEELRINWFEEVEIKVRDSRRGKDCEGFFKFFRGFEFKIK